MHNNIIVLVIIWYFAKYNVFLYVEKIPSRPIVGNINMGIGENIFNPIDNSLLFNKRAIEFEKKNKKAEKIIPTKNKILFTFKTIE